MCLRLGRRQVEVERELVRRARSERLPRRGDLARLLPRPLEDVRRQLADRRGAKREARDNAEVPAASAAAGPEEVGVAPRVAAQDVARGGHDRQSLERVAGEPELAHRVAVAAAEGEAGDAHRRACPGRDHQPVRSERRVDVDEDGAGADDCASAGNAHAVQARDVEDDAGRRRVAAVAVPAGARHEVDVVAPRPADRVDDVADRLAEDDRLRTDGVEARAVEEPRLVVAGARGRDDVAGEAAAKLTQARRQDEARRRPRRRAPGSRRFSARDRRSGRARGRRARPRPSRGRPG